MDKKKLAFLYLMKPAIDTVFAVGGVVVLALTFSITKNWFKVTSELDWIAALVFFFGLRIGNRLDLLKEPKDTGV